MQIVLAYLQPLRRNSLLKCVSQPKIAKNLLKPPILGVQSHSRLSMLAFLLSSLPVLVIISMYVPICNHFHIKRANGGRITSFLKGCLYLAPSFVGTPFTQWHEISSWNTRDTRLSYGENPKSLSQLVLKRYQVMTDRRTDRWTNRITIANARYRQLASSSK